MIEADEKVAQGDNRKDISKLKDHDIEKEGCLRGALYQVVLYVKFIIPQKVLNALTKQTSWLLSVLDANLNLNIYATDSSLKKIWIEMFKSDSFWSTGLAASKHQATANQQLNVRSLGKPFKAKFPFSYAVNSSMEQMRTEFSPENLEQSFQQIQVRSMQY